MASKSAKGAGATAESTAADGQVDSSDAAASAAAVDSTGPTLKEKLHKAAKGGVDALQQLFDEGGFTLAALSEAVVALSNDAARKLFAELASLAAKAAESGGPINQVFATLSCIANSVFAWCEDAAHPSSEGLRNCAAYLAALAEQANAANRAGRELRSSILRMAERYFTQKRPNHEEVIAAAMPAMVVDALPEVTAAGAIREPTDASVKRLWAVREAFALFDFADADTEGFTAAVLELFTSPALLRSADNRRVLSHLLATVPELVPGIGVVIREAIPGPAARMEAYGEVLLRGWSGAEGSAGARLAIEHGIVQDVLHRACHAAFPETFRGARRLLGALVDSTRRKARGVDGMLTRAYEPVIFRALQAPNALVRLNAAHLFLDAFPLRDGELPQGELDVLLQSQFEALVRLLGDEAPPVREAAVAGVGRVLRTYWELIPGGSRRALLDRLADDAATDVRAPSVRAAVPPAIAAVLEHAGAVEAVKAVLPRVGLLLHDRSPRVRLAVVSLLGRVATTRGLTVEEAAPQGELLARLALDATSPALATGLARLLLGAFFPPAAGAGGASDGGGELPLLRMLREHEAATFVFLSYARDAGVPLEALARAALQLKAALDTALARPGSGSGAGGVSASAAAAALAAVSESDDEDEEGDDAAAPAEAEDAEDGESESEDEDEGFTRKKAGRGKGKTKAKGKAAVAASSRGRSGSKGPAPRARSGSAGAGAVPKPKAVKRGRDGEPKPAPKAKGAAAAASTEGAAAAAAAPLPPLPALVRAIALIWSAVAAPLGLAGGEGDDEASSAAAAAAAAAEAALAAADAAASKAAKSRAKGVAAGKGKNAKAASAAAAAAAEESARAASAAADAGRSAGLRRELVAAFDGRQLASLMQAFSGLAVASAPGSGAASVAASSAGTSPTKGSGAAGAADDAAASLASAMGAFSLSADDAASVQASLLAIGEQLPRERAEGLQPVLWRRLMCMSTAATTATTTATAAATAGLGALSPADASALPWLLQCLCAWGWADRVLDAAVRAVRAAAETLLRGEPLQHQPPAFEDAADADDSSAGAGAGAGAAARLGASGSGSGAGTLHPAVALLAIQHVAALSSRVDATAGVGASAAKLTDALSCLKHAGSYVVKALKQAHTEALTVPTPAAAGAGLALPEDKLLARLVASPAVPQQLLALCSACFAAWSSLIMQQVTHSVPAAMRTASAAAAGATSAGAGAGAGAADDAAPAAASPVGSREEAAVAGRYVDDQLRLVVRWCAEHLLPAVLRFADVLERGIGGFAVAAVSTALAPLEAGCRAVFATVASTAADCVASGLTVPCAVGLLRAFTADDHMTLELPAAGSSSTSSAGAGTVETVVAGFSPVEWLGNVELMKSMYAAAAEAASAAGGAAAGSAVGGAGGEGDAVVEGEAAVPVEVAASYAAAVRLAMCLHASAAAEYSSAPGSAYAYSGEDRGAIALGLTRLLMLAPQPMDAEEDEAEGGDDAAAIDEDGDDSSSGSDGDGANGGARTKSKGAAAASASRTLSGGPALVDRCASAAVAALVEAADAAPTPAAASAAESALVAFVAQCLAPAEQELDTTAPALQAYVLHCCPDPQAAAAALAAAAAEAGARKGKGKAKSTAAAAVPKPPSAEEALGRVPAALLRALAASAPSAVARALSSRAVALADWIASYAAQAAAAGGSIDGGDDGSSSSSGSSSSATAGPVAAEPFALPLLAMVVAAVQGATAAAADSGASKQLASRRAKAAGTGATARRLRRGSMAADEGDGAAALRHALRPLLSRRFLPQPSVAAVLRLLADPEPEADDDGATGAGAGAGAAFEPLPSLEDLLALGSAADAAGDAAGTAPA